MLYISDNLKSRLCSLLTVTLLMIMLCVLVLIDVATKMYMKLLLDRNDNMIVVNSFLGFVGNWNKGVAFGFLSNAPDSLLLFFVFIASAVMLLLFVKIKDLLSRLVFILIIGGAVGNGLDRGMYGAVYDFIDLHIGNLHWPLFNLADIFINIGGLLWVFISIKRKRGNGNEKDLVVNFSDDAVGM